MPGPCGQAAVPAPYGLVRTGTERGLDWGSSLSARLLRFCERLTQSGAGRRMPSGRPQRVAARSWRNRASRTPREPPTGTIKSVTRHTPAAAALAALPLLLTSLATACYSPMQAMNCPAGTATCGGTQPQPARLLPYILRRTPHPACAEPNGIAIPCVRAPRVAPQQTHHASPDFP
jgi:hypothetical protein